MPDSLRVSKLLLRAGVSAFIVMMPAGAQVAATGAAPPGQEPPARTSALEEIVVTGIRASLEKSLDIKKNAGVVLDSINATELGRFPDADVADSLSHLPGITITRTTGGEGQKVNVRGLGPEYNIVTLNNRILATDDDARDLAFDVLPSELIAGADVLKSPEAAALEGSIGGTVNLRTANPFDNPGLHGGVHVEGNYNSMSTLHGTKYSAFIENTNATGTLGFLVGVVHSDNNLRTDSLNAYNQENYGPNSYPFDPNDTTTPRVALTALPCCITFGSIYDKKKRDALSGTLEWRPNESFRLTADALWTRLRDPQIGYNESYYFAYSTNPDGSPAWTNPTIQNGVVTAVTSSNFQPEMVNNTTDRNVNTALYGLNGRWQPNDRLTLDLDVYRSTASRPEGGADTFVTAGLVTDQPYAPDTLIMTDRPHSLPDLNVLVPPSQLGLAACPAGTGSATNPGSCSYTALMNSGLLNDNKYWSTHYVGLNGYSVHDAITSFALDGSYDTGLAVFSKLRFGLGESRREKSRVDSSNDWTNGSGQYGTLYVTAGCPAQCNPYTFASQGFNVVSMIKPPNFMQGAGGSFPTTLPQLDAQALLAFLKSLDGKPNPYYCPPAPDVCTGPYTPFNFADTLPQPNPFNSYNVTEKTTSFYLEAQFAHQAWSGNVGLRVVRTTATASYAEAVPVSAWTPTIVGSTQTWNVQYAPATPVSTSGAYTLALPSANLSYWLIPNQLQFRSALAETMSRPNLNQLAPNATNNAINGDWSLFYSGKAGLKPIKAYQADLSLEWYYAPHSAITLAVFGKRVTDDIYSGVTPGVDLGTLQYIGGPPGTVPGAPALWTIHAPANGAKSTFTGFELSWQHMLHNGFGLYVQYTHTQSKGYDETGASTGPVNAVPPTTVAISLFYDKGPFSADINWEHTSSYSQACSQCTEIAGWPAIADPFEWLTASAHYKFARRFEVYIEGKNLTNAIARTYLNGNPLLPWAPGQSVGQSASGVGSGYSTYGRSFVAGLAYRL
ncbi:MAG: TonB-dependent receptor [Gammaproteobacteria bacterium]|nr:TonB-dependent receptor [Gammaproteobacteria bacterium]